MSILDELAETLVASDLQRLGRYLIDDTAVPDGDRRFVVLLFESPHTLEVCRGHPLAGDAGLSVTRALSGPLSIPEASQSCPFGDLLTSHVREEVAALASIRVMNFCQLPMQYTAYPNGVAATFKQLFMHFRTLRNPLAARRNNRHRTRLVKSVLVANLRERINRIAHRAYFIPCGTVAAAYFAIAAEPQVERTHLSVPHPSRGAWLRDPDTIGQLGGAIVAAIGDNDVP